MTKPEMDGPEMTGPSGFAVAARTDFTIILFPWHAILGFSI